MSTLNNSKTSILKLLEKIKDENHLSFYHQKIKNEYNEYKLYKEEYKKEYKEPQINENKKHKVDNQNQDNNKEAVKEKNILFSKYIFMQMIRFYYFKDSLSKEWNLKSELVKEKRSINQNDLQKKINKIKEKFDLEDLENILKEVEEIQKNNNQLNIDLPKIYSLFKKKWLFDKYIEVQLCVILFARLSPKKEIDYNGIITIKNPVQKNKTQTSQSNIEFIINFLIDYSIFKWGHNGFYANDNLKINMYQHFLDCRVAEYKKASIK